MRTILGWLLLEDERSSAKVILVAEVNLEQPADLPDDSGCMRKPEQNETVPECPAKFSLSC